MMMTTTMMLSPALPRSSAILIPCTPSERRIWRLRSFHASKNISSSSNSNSSQNTSLLSFLCPLLKLFSVCMLYVHVHMSVCVSMCMYVYPRLMQVCTRVCMCLYACLCSLRFLLLVFIFSMISWCIMNDISFSSL